jgi:hypothetical protein
MYNRHSTDVPDVTVVPFHVLDIAIPYFLLYFLEIKHCIAS